VLGLYQTLKALLNVDTFLWGKVFDAKSAGRNYNNCDWRNFEI